MRSPQKAARKRRHDCGVRWLDRPPLTDPAPFFPRTTARRLSSIIGSGLSPEHLDQLSKAVGLLTLTEGAGGFLPGVPVGCCFCMGTTTDSGPGSLRMLHYWGSRGYAGLFGSHAGDQRWPRRRVPGPTLINLRLPYAPRP
jgi:hypothetical protein